MLLLSLRSSGSAMLKCSTSGAATEGALEGVLVDACVLRASASVRLAWIAARAASASLALSSMISTCGREAELAEDDGTLTTSSAELSISITGTAGTVDGILDDSMVTTVEDAGADGAVVGVLALEGVGDDDVDDTSIMSAHKLRLITCDSHEVGVRGLGLILTKL